MCILRSSFADADALARALKQIGSWFTSHWTRHGDALHLALGYLSAIAPPLCLMTHADFAAAKASRAESWEYLLISLEALLVDNWVANLANASSLLWHHFAAFDSSVNWAGFYVINKKQLILGPFQGKPACQYIEFGKGVCGAAASTRKTQFVADVHQFPGHIACDGDTNSEIVVPMVHNDEVVGVLDIDCTEKNGFDEQDRVNLEKVALMLTPSLAAGVAGS